MTDTDTATDDTKPKASDTADALGINVNKLIGDSLAVPSGSWANDLRTKLEKNQADKDKELDPLRKKVSDTFERDQSETDAARKAIDPTHIEPWTQKPPEPDPVQAFGSFGSAFAVLASAFTKQPAINALNASAAAMNAVRANDVDGYNEAHKAWKENTTVALERHKQQMDDYHAAFDKMKTDMDAGRLMLTTAAQKYGDQQMLMLKEGDLLAHADNLVTSRANAARGMLTALPRLEEMAESQKILMSDPDWLSGDPKRMAAAKARANQKTSMTSGVTQAKTAAINQAVQEFTDKNGRDPTAQELAGIIKDVTSTGLTGNKRQQMEERVDQFDNSLTKIDDVTSILDNYIGAAGLAGRAGRLGEVVGNIFGSNDTDRTQFRRNIEYLQTMAHRLLTDASGRPLSSDAARIDDIIGGLSMGDTTANTKRSLDEVKRLYTKMQSDARKQLDGSWSPKNGGTSSDEPGATPKKPKSEQPWLNDPVVGTD